MSDKYIKLENVFVSFQTEAKENEHGKKRFFSKTEKKVVNALNDVSFTIHKGERVGIIGLNGAGKSTLLRVMAGIYRPHSGNVDVVGKVNPMFELATGVELEMTGWENIILRGQLLGIPYEKIVEMAPSIGEFTELGDFLNYPVKTYSAGMFARLAFSVSTSIEPEILLLDEIVGAGDLQFEDKAVTRMKSLIETGGITVLTSHSMHLIEMYCDRAIWLESGHVRMDSDSETVIKEYLNSK